MGPSLRFVSWKRVRSITIPGGVTPMLASCLIRSVSWSKATASASRRAYRASLSEGVSNCCLEPMRSGSQK